MPNNILTTRPIAARLGAPVIVLLSGVTISTVLAAVWIPSGPPAWATGITASITIAMLLIAGYLNSRPSRISEPSWAKPFVTAIVTVAILVPLLAIFPASATPEIGGWVMTSIATGEVITLTLVITLVTRHRPR